MSYDCSFSAVLPSITTTRKLASHQRWFFKSLRLKENDAKSKVKIFIYFFCRKYIREIVCKLGNLADGSLQLNILDRANESDALFKMET